MKFIFYLFLISLNLQTTPIKAMVGSSNAEKNWGSIVYITFSFKHNVDQNQCSGFLLNDHQAISTAHCAIRDENGEKATSASVCIGKQFPFNRSGEACFSSKKVKFSAQYRYSTPTDFVSIELAESIPLNFLDIQPLNILPNSLAKRFINKAPSNISAMVISFGSRSFNHPSSGKKGKADLSNIQWDKITGLWQAAAPHVAYGRADDGAGLVIKIDRRWYLVGLLVKTRPDFFVAVEPFFDPCLPAEPGARQPAILLTSHFQFLSLNALNCFDESALRLPKDIELCALVRPLTRMQIKQQLKSGNNGYLAYYLFTKEKQPSKKLIYLQQAARAGYHKALFKMYQIYFDGEGVRPDKQKAAQFLFQAANSGDPEAEFQLAMHLKKSSLTIKTIHAGKPIKASQWFRYMNRAAEGGYAKAQFGMGIHYQKTDIIRSYNWIMRAARQGYAPAEFVLAQYLLQGKGTRKNAYMAKKWLEYSAGQGFLAAVAKLSHLKVAAYKK